MALRIAILAEECSNCGRSLTEEQIRLALEDAGEVTGEESELDHYSFCCPNYSDESGCPDYSNADRSLPAYWIYR